MQLEILVEDALAHGANLVTGGKRHGLGKLFYEPTLLKDVKSFMKVSQEEIFGPIAAVQKYVCYLIAFKNNAFVIF